ncbi:MAG: DNA internalization-related competence protein ComEC/Rec2 [Chloroflexi bacterium]|nr:DNA internalization-related competence protein ComEC/Rec2 [Chloroflexota bacterium]
MALIYLSCAWVAGIFLGSKLALPLALVCVGLVPLPLLFFVRQHRKPIVLISLCLVIFFGGAFYFKSSLPGTDANYLRFYNGRGLVEVSGVVNRYPETGGKTAHLYLSAENITVSEERREVFGTVLLVVPVYPAYSYGDVLRVRGELETPPSLDGFDYEAYLAHQGVYSTMLYPEILEAKAGSESLQWVYSLRNRLSQTLAEVLPEPQASLAQGIILGIRGNIPETVNSDFIRSGTAHLLAISGVNLTIVAGIMLSLGIWLFGKKGFIYIWLALGAVWFYALLTGMQPPVFRAVIMVSLFLVADLLGRQRNAVTALALAAAVMVAIDPNVLWDAAFQMSFMAMAGLIFIFPRLQSLSRKTVNATLGEEGVAVSVANFVADSFSVTLAAISAVWPLIAYYFGVISWIAPLANLLALPVLPGIIISGSLAAGLGLLVMPVAQVIAWIAWLFASYLLLVVKAFATVSPIEGGSVSPAVILLYYSILALSIWLVSNRKKMVEFMSRVIVFVPGVPVKWVIPPLLVVAILVVVVAVTMPDDNLHVSFLDVGQGSAVLIQKGSQQVLVDGGPSPQALTVALGKKMPFWDRTIDLLVLTHHHADHITGQIEVLNRYKVGQVLSANLTDESPLYTEWLSLIEEKDIKYVTARAGQQINFGEAVIEVLNPQIPLFSGTDSDIDNNGVVLHVRMGKVSFLLTADIMWEAEFDLIARRVSLASTVLEVAHHGSATSTTAEFLAMVSPRLAVISVGKDNSFGHPSQEVVDRLKEKLGQEKIYYTSENGTIEFITNRQKLWVKVEK